jgi:pyruvate-formate lyase-activating enzyme
LRRAEASLARGAPPSREDAGALLLESDEALLHAWVAAEQAALTRKRGTPDASLETFAFYRRELLRRLARGGARIGPEALAALFQGSAGCRMFMFVTHACQLRCSYCHVSKNPAEMSPATIDAGVRLMLRSLRREVEFHFFGGEPMLAFAAVKRATLLAESLAAAAGKSVRFLLTTNGIELGDEELRFIKEHRFSLEFSCDGAHESQLRQRAPAGGRDYYARLQENLSRLRDAGVSHNVITVVMPETASTLFEKFRYLADLGHRRIQINYALGSLWGRSARTAFFREMLLAARWARSNGIEFVNLTARRREPVILNGDLTLDCDGTLFRGPVLFNGGLTRETDGRRMRESGGASASGAYAKVRELFHAGKVDGALLPDYYGATQFDNFVSLTRAYRDRPRTRAVILDNIEMGLLCRRFAASWRRS